MIGPTISHFRILGKIAEGGMGVVYEAGDLKLGRTVALKVLPSHLVGDEERRARFVREARAAAAVTHPNIATVYEIDEEEGFTFIAMELVEGKSLRSLIGGQPLPMKDAVRLGTEIAEGLAAAHRANIVHRDLKPENVIVGKDGHVKIIDFGLARLLGEGQPGAPSDSALTSPMAGLETREGVVLGTPAYMSPEQARGQEIDFRTDVFSFGSTLYEMVTGRPPFQAKTTTDTISDILNKEPLPAAGLNPEVPSSVQWILDKCLEKDTSQRYQDTRDLVVDLRHLYPETGTHGFSRTFETGSRAAAAFPSQATRPRWLTAQRTLFLAAVAMLAVVAILALPRMLRRGGLPVPTAEANSLAIFSFDNLKDPEDPERLGQILQELLITDLSELEPLQVLSSQRLFDIRKQISRAAGETPDKELVTTVATHAGVQNMLTGTLSQLGARWILTCQLVDVGSGRVIRSKRIDGTDLYAMVDMLTEEIQADLRAAMPGEAVAKVPVREKTTSSIEAYQHYLAGVDWLNGAEFPKAVEELERAIATDPDFGQAYYKLGIAKWWRGDDIHGAQEPLSQLLSRGLYASPKERLMAEGIVALVAERFGEGLSVFERLTEEFPDEKEVWYGLGEALFHFPGGGKSLEGLDALRRAVALDPDFSLPYRHIFDIYQTEHMAEEALADAEALIEGDPDNPSSYRYWAASIAMKQDDAETEKAIAKALRHNTTAEDRKQLYMTLGREAWGRFDYERAREYWQKALELDPDQDDPELQLGLLEILADQRKFDEHKDEVHKALARNPTYPAYLSALFDVYEREWRYAEALARAESLAVNGRDDPRSYRRWAFYAVRMGDEASIATAIAEAKRRHETRDEQRQLNSTLGWAYMRCGDVTEAKEYFDEALAADPDREYANVYQSLGVNAFLRGQYDEMEEWFLKGLEINQKHSGLLISQMYARLEHDDFEEAIDYAKRAVELYPRSSGAHRFLIYPYVRTGKVAEAGRLLESALSTMHSVGDKWDLLADENHGVAWCYLYAGLYEKAEETFRMAAALDPKGADPLVSVGLGMTYLAREEEGRAEQAFLQALEESPRHPSALLGLASARLVRKEYAEAERRVREQMKAGPVDGRSSALLGHIYAEQGHFHKALSLAEKIVSMNPSRTNRELLAWVLVAGDIDIDRGIELASRALEVPPFDSDPAKTFPFRPPAEHTLGLATFKQRRYREAVEHLQRAAALRPNRESIQTDLERARGMLAGTQ